MATLALYNKGRPPHQLPVRHVRPSPARHRAHPRELRHHGKTDRGGLFQKRHSRTGRDLVARQLSWAGVTEHDVVQIGFSYSLFTGGLGYHFGAEKMGASVIPASTHGNLRDQVTIMKDFKTYGAYLRAVNALWPGADHDVYGHPSGADVPEARHFRVRAVERNVRGEIEGDLPASRHTTATA